MGWILMDNTMYADIFQHDSSHHLGMNWKKWYILTLGNVKMAIPFPRHPCARPIVGDSVEVIESFTYLGVDMLTLGPVL